MVRRYKTAKDSLTGAIYVSNIDNGDYIKIRSVDFGKGATKFEATVASLSSKGNIELRADSLSGKLLGKLEAKSTKILRIGKPSCVKQTGSLVYMTCIWYSKVRAVSFLILTPGA